jgi:hypothetical protein
VGVVYYYYTRIWTLQIASSVAVKKKYWKREIRGRGLYKEGRDNKENSKILGKLIAPIARFSGGWIARVRDTSVTVNFC